MFRWTFFPGHTLLMLPLLFIFSFYGIVNRDRPQRQEHPFDSRDCRMIRSLVPVLGPGMPLLLERNMFQGTPIYICWSNTLKDNINSSLQQYFNWIFLLSNWKNSWNNLGRIKAIDNICIVAIETLCDKNNENENYRGKQWHSNKQKSWNVLAAVLF